MCVQNKLLKKKEEEEEETNEQQRQVFFCLLMTKKQRQDVHFNWNMHELFNTCVITYKKKERS